MAFRTGLAACAAFALVPASDIHARVLFSGPAPLQGRPLVPLSAPSSARSGLAARSLSSLGGPDTLEVYAFLADFRKESPDNTSTTGDGTFGSDSSTSTPMESWKARRDSTRRHFLRVFQGVTSYWRDASGGRLEVVFRVFPEASEAKPYHVDRTIGQCSPLKGSEETNASFDSTYSTRVLEWVSDASRAAAADASGPFSEALPSSSSRHRAFLLVHAGADRSTDGGDKGASSANTAQDLGSFALGRYDFRSLSDRKRIVDTTHLRDSMGIALGKPGADTLRELLVAAETGSQDGADYGIRGTVTYLVGRALGIPDLWDAAQGLSVMGRFCLMDPAGWSLGRGYLPSLPSAWPRLYMGWATPVPVAPDSGTGWRSLPAVRPGHDSVLVVRVADGEYLLLENRQRTDSDGKVWVRVGGILGNDSTTIQVARDSLDTLLKDGKRAKGYLYSASPDAALPGSGLLVWHVNEWLLQQLVRYGSPNSYLGDTLGDRYRGVTLVQASGVPSLGQAFQSVSGAATDVGSGADMLPHIERSSSRNDTITAIGPEGWTSTGSLLGGRSLLTLRSPWPSGALAQKGVNTLNGDSVWTPGADPIRVRVEWGRYVDTSLAFPVRLPPGWGDASFLPGPSALARSLWYLDSAGRAQVLDSAGKVWFRGGDTLKFSRAWDSVASAFATRPTLDSVAIRWPRIGDPLGRPVSSAVQVDTLAALSRGGTASLLWPLADAFSEAHRDSARVGQASVRGVAAGPVLAGGRLWFADTSGAVCALSRAGAGARVATGLHRIQALCALGSGSALAAVDSAARVVVVAGSDAKAWAVSSAVPDSAETFRILSADFQRDGKPDLLVVGSRGTSILWDGATREVAAGWPRRFERGAGGHGDPGCPALGDVDGDGRPEIAIPGTDKIWLVDASGVSLPGWPAPIKRTESTTHYGASTAYPSGILGSSPLLADLGRDGKTEIVLGSPDGMVRAWSADGKPWTGPVLSSTSGAVAGPAYAQGSWPLSAGGATLDTIRPPFLPTALLASGSSARLVALSSLSTLEAFDLGSVRVLWGWSGGDPGRSGSLPDSLLGSAQRRPDGISDFHLFPSPVREGKATFRWTLGSEAKSVRLSVWEQTGARAFQRSDLSGAAGRNELSLAGLRWGTGVYAARLEVEWTSGGKAEAWVRFGVAK